MHVAFSMVSLNVWQFTPNSSPHIIPNPSFLHPLNLHEFTAQCILVIMFSYKITHNENK